jgi:imidazolonepropionase
VGSVRYDGIGELVTNDPATGDGSLLGLLHDAAVVVEDGRVVWVGSERVAPDADERHHLDGRAVVPAFVDSHSHLVFGGDRTEEFAARMAGRSYAAGGIRTTVAATRVASDELLLARSRRLLAEMRRQGTGLVEIKSGYGLTVEDEARSLRIAAELTEETTFLGAHVVPAEFADDPDGYLDLVVGPMLDACAPLARWIDVFVEAGAFDADAARTILTAGRDRGLGLRVHANQLRPGPGVTLACELGAASADHLAAVSDAGVNALAGGHTVATLLPGTMLFLGRAKQAPARRLIEAGAAVALATDFNPGTSPTVNFPLILTLGVSQLRMSAAETLIAATVNGAAALGLAAETGQIAPGFSADLALFDADDYRELPYWYGDRRCRGTWARGRACHPQEARSTLV